MLNKIDIAAGKMTYSQRIELGKILISDCSTFDKLIQSIKCLHDFDVQILPGNAQFYGDYFEEICEGILSWVEKEQKLLTYKPTPEELKAGIKELSEKVGDFGTIKALAKAYHKDPDEILSWEYGKVFGILYTDMEEFRFSQRYEKVIKDKYKQK